MYPSFRSEYAITFSDIHTLSYSLGWSPAFLERLQYLNRKIIEKKSVYKDSKTEYTNPVYGLMSSAKYLIVLGDHQLSLTPYFGWYYNFHGIFSQFMVEDSEEIRGYTFKPVRYGYGTGTTLKWGYSRDIHVLELSYTLAFANFQTKDDAWLPSLDDKRHVIGIHYSITPYKAFNFSLTSSIVIDSPFTPTVITGQNTKKQGELHAGREYFPNMSLIPSVSGNFIDNDVLAFDYRFSLGDILSFVYFKRELKDKETVGVSDKDIDNRKYTMPETRVIITRWMEYFELALYVTFKL